jgi:hypothetical protein
MSESTFLPHFASLILAGLFLSVFMMALGWIIDSLRIARWPRGLVRFALSWRFHAHS